GDPRSGTRAERWTAPGTASSRPRPWARRGPPRRRSVDERPRRPFRTGGRQAPALDTAGTARGDPLPPIPPCPAHPARRRPGRGPAHARGPLRPPAGDSQTGASRPGALAAGEGDHARPAPGAERDRLLLLRERSEEHTSELQSR